MYIFYTCVDAPPSSHLPRSLSPPRRKDTTVVCTDKLWQVFDYEANGKHRLHIRCDVHTHTHTHTGRCLTMRLTASIACLEKQPQVPSSSRRWWTVSASLFCPRTEIALLLA